MPERCLQPRKDRRLQAECSHHLPRKEKLELQSSAHISVQVTAEAIGGSDGERPGAGGLTLLSRLTSVLKRLQCEEFSLVQSQGGYLATFSGSHLY